MLDGDDTILASIRDRSSILEIFAHRKPQIVFHAAALKHMPLLEHYPLEALKTNVLGAGTTPSEPASKPDANPGATTSAPTAAQELATGAPLPRRTESGPCARSGS